MTDEKNELNGEEWVIIDKQKVITKHVPPGFFVDGFTAYKTEYIIKNTKTGEIKRV